MGTISLTLFYAAFAALSVTGAVGVKATSPGASLQALGEEDCIMCTEPGDCPSGWHDAWVDEEPNAAQRRPSQ
jgi:hypothetical protein